MKSTEQVLAFLSFLAEMHSIFRHAHLFSESCPALCNVSTLVIPFKGRTSDYADEGVTVSIALSADLRKPIDRERRAIGMSFLLRHAEGHWRAETEAGWIGEEVGWDPFDSRETQSTSIEEIISNVSPLVEWADVRFRAEVAKLSS